MVITVTLREGDATPPGAPWLVPGKMFTAHVILVGDQEAYVRIIGPGGARCIISSRKVRRIDDDWPDH